MNMLNNASDYLSGNVNKGKAKDLAAESADVTIEDNWKGDIKAGAFAGLENPVSINTNDITGIEDGAFKDCKRLETLIMPNIERVGENVFEGCSSLHKVDVKDENTAGLVIEKIKACNLKQRIDIYIAGKFKISIKNNCEYLFNDKVPELMEGDELRVPHYDFTGMKENVISAEAFKDVSDLLQRLSILAVTEIEGNPFESCTNLHRVEVKDQDMAEIVIGKIRACNLIQRIDIYIAGEFKISIKNNCEYLFRDKVRELIEEDEFEVPHYDFTKMKENVISAGAFKNIDIEKVYADVTTIIEDNAFENCWKMREIYLSSVREIGNEVFKGCICLRKVHVSNGMEGKIKEVLLEANLKQQIRICVNDTIVGYLHDNLSRNIFYIDARWNENWILSNDMEIPEYYTKIDSGAIRDIDRVSINTSNVTTLGNGVCANCSKLKSVYIPNVQEIGDNFCYGCPNLREITVKDETMAKVVEDIFSKYAEHQVVDVNIYVKGSNEPYLKVRAKSQMDKSKFLSLIKQICLNLNFPQETIETLISMYEKNEIEYDCCESSAVTFIKALAGMSGKSLPESKIESMIDEAMSEIDN